MTAVLDAATVDLLGVLAYGELTASERLANDAQLAPTLDDKIALGTMAHQEFGHYLSLQAHLLDAGVDVVAAMNPFVPAIDAFHESTQPSDWYEGLVKAYVGDGMAADFYREASAYVKDDATRALIQTALADAGKPGFAVSRIREAIATEPALAGRLALWGRRLVGEAILQAQQVAVERDALLELLVGSGDLAGITRLFNTITERHTERMHTLGLQS